MKSKALYIIVLTLISTFSFSQKVEVKLSVDMDDIMVGTPIVITATSGAGGAIEIESPDEFNTGVGVQSGMQKEMNFNSGKMNTVYFTSQSGTFSKEGKYTFYAVLHHDNKAYKSNVLTVRVNKRETVIADIPKNSRQTVFGLIEKSKSKVYEGEFVRLNAKIFSKFDLAVQNFEPYTIVGAVEKIPVKASSDLIFTPQVINGKNYHTAVLERQLVFFKAPGKYKINPFGMRVIYDTGDDYEDLKFVSNREDIEVIPLPPNAPADFIGGVGVFSCQRNFSKTEVTQGDIVVMNIEVAGAGNIHNIRPPLFKLPEGIALYGDPEINRETSYGIKGTEGKITYKYHLQMTNAGTFEIPELHLSYFDPNRKEYITMRESGAKIQIAEDKNYQRGYANNSAELQTTRIGNDKMIQKGNVSQHKGTSNAVLIVSAIVAPIALSFLFIFFIRKRRKEIEDPLLQSIDLEGRSKAARKILLVASSKAQLCDYVSAFKEVERAVKLIASVHLKSECFSLSGREIEMQWLQNGLSSELCSQISGALSKCEEGRYLMSGQNELFVSVLEISDKLISHTSD